MGSIVGEIFQIMTGSLGQIATGLAGGITDMVQNLFVSGAGTSADPYALSIFGTIVCIFGAVSLGFGLFRWCLNFITSLGNRNR